MELVHTVEAPQPGGHYSQAVIQGDLVFVSGLLPITPNGAVDHTTSFEDQVECVLGHAEKILAKAGSSLSNVVKTAVYVADMAEWSSFDKIYARHFGDHKPARVVLGVAALHHGFKIEIDLIAQRQSI
jgi:2-iminobutanoate/2-iminopropanoate deaminase